MLRRQFASGYFFEKTIVHCLIFREDNSPVLRRQLYSAQFMVKITVFREDNQPVLHLQRRQSASASHFEKTILPVLKKTILLEKTILPFPVSIRSAFTVCCVLNKFNTYREVGSIRLSWLVSHPSLFRMFMKEKFDAYVLWPSAKRVQNWIVDLLPSTLWNQIVICTT